MKAPTVRVVVNQRTLAAIHDGLAATLAAVGQRAIELARPNVPDEPPYGAGLVASGAFAVVDGDQVVAGDADVPAGVDIAPGLALVAGYDFPARFNERGTIHQPARPFFDPAMVEAIAELPATAQQEVRSRLR